MTLKRIDQNIFTWFFNAFQKRLCDRSIDFSFSIFFFKSSTSTFFFFFLEFCVFNHQWQKISFCFWWVLKSEKKKKSVHNEILWIKSDRKKKYRLKQNIDKKNSDFRCRHVVNDFYHTWHQMWLGTVDIVRWWVQILLSISVDRSMI